MVAAGPSLSLSLEDAVADGRSEGAGLAAARELAAGADPRSVARRAVEVALELCGREAAGASWSQGLLSVGAATALVGRDGAAAALVGAVGFLAHARPSRTRQTEPRPIVWPGTREWVDLIRENRLGEAIGAWASVGEDRRDAWAAASTASVGGWGATSLIGGGFARMGAALGLRDALDEAAIRAWVSLEPDPLFAEPEGDVEDGVEAVAGAISQGTARARAQAPSRWAVEGAALAALELARRTPDLRSVRGVLLAREYLALPSLDEGARDRLLAFVGSGWDRARWDRRLRGAAKEWGGGPPADVTGDLDAAVAELCRIEARPGFGHNLLLAEAGVALAERLPQRRGLVGAAVAGTLPAWSRSRRPWLMLRSAKNPQRSGIVARPK